MINILTVKSNPPIILKMLPLFYIVCILIPLYFYDKISKKGCEMMAKASTRAQNKYNQKTYTQLNFRLKKDEAEKLKKYCQEHGTSVNGYITRLIREDMELSSIELSEEEANMDYKDLD